MRKRTSPGSTWSPIFADEMGGELYLQLYIALPNRAGNDFVVHSSRLPTFKTRCLHKSIAPL